MRPAARQRYPSKVNILIHSLLKRFNGFQSPAAANEAISLPPHFLSTRCSSQKAFFLFLHQELNHATGSLHLLAPCPECSSCTSSNTEVPPHHSQSLCKFCLNLTLYSLPPIILLRYTFSFLCSTYRNHNHSFAYLVPALWGQEPYLSSSSCSSNT